MIRLPALVAPICVLICAAPAMAALGPVGEPDRPAPGLQPDRIARLCQRSAPPKTLPPAIRAQLERALADAGLSIRARQDAKAKPLGFGPVQPCR